MFGNSQLSNFFILFYQLWIIFKKIQQSRLPCCGVLPTFTTGGSRANPTSSPLWRHTTTPLLLSRLRNLPRRRLRDPTRSRFLPKPGNRRNPPPRLQWRGGRAATPPRTPPTAEAGGKAENLQKKLRSSSAPKNFSFEFQQNSALVIFRSTFFYIFYRGDVH